MSIHRCGASAPLLLGVMMAGTDALAQPAAPPADSPQPTPAATAEIAGAMALGKRVSATLAAARVIPTVVIATDVWSYVDAISRWTPTLRYPVLLDDGTPAAAENIGRFVRAFGPNAVVMYKIETPAGEPRNGLIASVRIDSAAGRAWGMTKDVTRTDDLVRHWDEIGHVPPGVIVADPKDDAWPAALALSAARGEPILWESLPGNLNGMMQLEDARKLTTMIEIFCASTLHTWDRIGDQLDAVTICANSPVKVHVAETPGEGQRGLTRETVALTDHIGRHHTGPGALRQGRWAWAGQIPGDGPSAAYRAMCAIFLRPSSAWVFDSYTEPGAWQVHDGGATKAALEGAGWTVRLDDAPNATPADWRIAAAKPLDASLIMVTTMGNAGFFELGHGDRCYPGDLPLLERPAMLHFVHSWSLLAPGKADTIGARWLDRGVYAYAGSVQEPMLSAFVPTPLVADRVIAGMPWGAAARVEGGMEWRIAILGDPLITAGQGTGITREDGPLPMDATIDVDSELRSAIRAKEYARSLRLMALLGRDEDAVRLAGAVLREDEQGMTPEAAAYVVGPAFRAADLSLLARAQQRMAGADAKQPRVLDRLWNLARQQINTVDKEQRDRVLDILRSAVREEQSAADGIELTRWIRRYRTRAEAEAFAQTVRPMLKLPREQKELDGALNGRE